MDKDILIGKLNTRNYFLNKFKFLKDLYNQLNLISLSLNKLNGKSVELNNLKYNLDLNFINDSKIFKGLELRNAILNMTDNIMREDKNI